MSGPTKADLLGEIEDWRVTCDGLSAERDEAWRTWAHAQDIANEHHRATVQVRQELDAAEVTADGYRQQLAAAAVRIDGLEGQLAAERDRYSRAEGELRLSIEELEAGGDDLKRRLDAAGAELARVTQTSHDREAALTDALVAVARSRP